MALRLQETKLDLLRSDECRNLGAELNANSTLELCTGKKKLFPQIVKLKRIRNVKSKKYYFEYISKVTNYLGFEKTKYPFYLGGTDSCQGIRTFKSIWTNLRFRAGLTYVRIS